MNFTHLEYAVAVAKHGSINRASQELFVPQPYLSNTIKKLEEELGFPIFKRTKSGVSTTALGQKFISSACRILLELHKINELSSSTKEEPLKVASYYSTFIMNVFLEFIQNLKDKSSDCINEMGVREIFQSILSGESSLGIFFYAPVKRNVYFQMGEEYHCCCTDLFPLFHLYVLALKNHPLTSRSRITLQDILKYNYVTFNDTASLKYLQLLGLQTTRQVLQVSDRGSFLDAIRTGDYISLTSALEMPTRHDFALIPIDDDRFYINSCYVTSKNYQLTDKEHEFIQYLRKKYSECMQNLS